MSLKGTIFFLPQVSRHKNVLIISRRSDDGDQGSVNGTNYVGEFCHPQEILLGLKNFLQLHQKGDNVKGIDDDGWEIP